MAHLAPRQHRQPPRAGRDTPRTLSRDKTHRLSRAPPTSQSQGRQPWRSWLRAQCSGCGERGRQGAAGRGATALSTVPSPWHGPEHRAWPLAQLRAPCTAPATAPLTRHWSQLRPVTSRLQRQSPLMGSHRPPSATVPRGSHRHPAQGPRGTPQGRATRSTPAGAPPVPLGPTPTPAAVRTLAALRVGSAEPEEAGFAAVAAGALHVLLAAALPRDQPPGRVVGAVAQPPVQGALGVAVAGWGTGRVSTRTPRVGPTRP